MSYVSLDSALTEEELMTQFESSRDFEEQMEVAERTFSMGFYREARYMFSTMKQEAKESEEQWDLVRA